jgi:3-deoxy-7-phosphoheptulonate synthase
LQLLAKARTEFGEVHPNPDEALKDGAQSLTIDQFKELMPQAHAVAQAIGRVVVTE